MFPFASHKEHGYRLTSLPIAYANLQKAGAFAKEHNMRITVHPGQWTQLASPREVVVENAILELEYQCEMLDAMGVGNEGVMVIHMVRSRRLLPLVCASIYAVLMP
jgi:UV DNA damage endonuclease